MFTPPPSPRHEILVVRGARGTLRAATSGPCVERATDFPSPPLKGTSYELPRSKQTASVHEYGIDNFIPSCNTVIISFFFNIFYRKLTD